MIELTEAKGYFCVLALCLNFTDIWVAESGLCLPLVPREGEEEEP